MSVRLRKKRVAGAIIILIALIALVCFLIFKSCGNDKGQGRKSNTSGQSQVNSTSKSETSTSLQAVIGWPNELSEYIKEYKGAGNIVSVNKTQDNEGKTVYKVGYKGTTIDSCFSYSRDTLNLSGEWTEEITDELYTFSRELSAYNLGLSCEPKAKNGYDLMITVKIK